MKAPAIQYKCGHSVDLTVAPEMALLGVAAADPRIISLIASEHPAVLPDIASKLLLERIQVGGA